jgi:predicted RNA-binding Zn ribbon-like protein
VEQGGTARQSFDLSGGALCLDFANSLGDRPDPHPNEYLESYADLLAFARQTGSLTETDLVRLLDESARRPADADAALARALDLREVIYRLFLALADSQPVPTADLAALNRSLAEALAQARVVEVEGVDDGRRAGRVDDDERGRQADQADGSEGGFQADVGVLSDAGRGEGQAPGRFGWSWADDPVNLEMPLWPVTRSAADLLTSSDLRSLRLCASDTCAWLFLDTSRNGSRRWCSMRTCGNRAKARRHHARVRAAVSAAGS